MQMRTNTRPDPAPVPHFGGASVFMQPTQVGSSTLHGCAQRSETHLN
jgi:hypothetical protein